MSNENHDRDFPADDLDRWVREQEPPAPSATFLSRCLATIVLADVAERQGDCPNFHGHQPGAIDRRSALVDENRTVPFDAAAEALVPVKSALLQPILNEQSLEIRRMRMRRRVLGVSGVLATTVALCLAGNLWFAAPAAAERAAEEVMTRGAAAVPNLSTVHIVTKMRTPPNDNFGVIILDCDLTTIEAWKQFGDQPKWRLEEPGRVVVMDGASVIQLMRAHKPNVAMRMPPGMEGWGPVLQLTDVKKLITGELRSALAKGWNMKLAHETTAAGQQKATVTVEAKAGLPEGDYLKNKYFEESDMRRVYRFDSKTQRLEAYEAYVHAPGGDVLVLAIERIEYDQPINPALFVLNLPDDVEWFKRIEKLPDNAKYEKMTPKEAAQAFFEACAKEDWDEVKKFWTQPLNEDIKKYLGGIEIVSLGEPFQSKGYAGGKGWFIPYEIKLKDGTVKKHNLAMRNDNKANRYEVDGGI